MHDRGHIQRSPRSIFVVTAHELFKQGFAVGTWNFFEAILVKGALGGVGGALKRKADSLVSKGTDIPDATELFAALQKTEMVIRLFFANDDAVEKAVQEMPKDVPSIPSTMRIHQAVTIAQAKLTCRDVGCLCTLNSDL